MGVLSEDLIEQELNVGTVFDVKNISVANTEANALTGLGWGLIPMKIGNPGKGAVREAIEELPIITDDKHRLRIDKEALLNLTLSMYTPKVRMEVMNANPEVSVSSFGNEVHYVVQSDHCIKGATYSPNVLLRLKLIG